MNAIDEIWRWYQTAKESLRATKRAISRDIAGVVTAKLPGLHGRTKQDNQEEIDRAEKELNNVVVLSMFAAFERLLRVHAIACAQTATITGTHPRHAAQMRTEFGKDCEFWNFERLIDVFEAVDSNIRGNVKQISAFRNWVAHGWFINEPEPVSATPTTTFDLLQRFLNDSGLA